MFLRTPPPMGIEDVEDEVDDAVAEGALALKGIPRSCSYRSTMTTAVGASGDQDIKNGLDSDGVADDVDDVAETIFVGITPATAASYEDIL